ncbi:MAG: SDR family NAD(P)-dependent oxidoreductase [Deltaproteobacteria bacterium]|nr:SDR family NAD(P)-dependent oxidoreductase [Deltaproteobacteria bacterium]
MESIVAITGGAGALGGALAEHLVRAGHKVAIFDMDRSKARAEELVAKLGAGAAIAFTGDFGDAKTWGAALAAVEAAFGAPPTGAALVAGGWDGGAPLHAAKDDSAYERMMHANVDTAYRALRALLPSMVEKRRGSIVVVGSRAVERPFTSAGAAAYAASKAAVVTMAQAVAQEVIDAGVRINAVLPSTMDTPANRAAMPSADASRWVSLDSAAGVIAFLLSDAARDVTGAALPVYGRA